MKKRSAGLIGAVTAALTFAASVPVSFAADANYEELILNVKNRLAIPENYTEFSNSGRYESDGRTMYSFTWSTADEESKSINVTCRDDGFVTYYHTNDGEYGGYDSLSMDEIRAENAARDFIAEADPELRDIVKLERRDGYSFGGVTYSLRAEFYGIEYYQTIGEIVVGKDYRIRSMSVDLPEVAEPDAAARYIGAEDGIAAYRDKIGVRTVYKTYRDEDGKLRAFPVYESIDDKAVDAVTGNVTDIGKSNDRSYGENESAADSSLSGGGSSNAGYKELNESELAQLAQLNNLITRDEAVTFVRERISAGFEPQSVNLYNDTDNRYYYSLYAENERYTVDAQNGDIIGLYVTIEDGAKDTTKLAGYGFEDRDSAKLLIEMLAPSDGTAYEYDEDGQDLVVAPAGETARKASSFVYKVNGIEVESADAYVSKYSDDGRTSYSVNITPLEEYKGLDYASPDTFADVNGLVFADSSYVSLKYADTPENGIIPVYIAEPFMKNAVSGADVDYRNEEYDPDGIEYSDISGHWAEDTALKLAAAGIGFKGGELRPDDPARAADAKELIEEIYGDNGAVEGVSDGSAPLTRLEAAEIIIKCEGLEDLAAMDIYAQPYTDITEDYGITAILKGYGVIDGTASEFRPNDTLTRAELLQMIYNTLVRFNG